MIASPGQWHVGVRMLDQDQAWWGKGWVMMHGIGKNVCDVRFHEKGPSGEPVRIDRVAALGFSDPDKAPQQGVRRVYRHQLQGHIRRMCRASGSDAAGLTVVARCAGYDGWEQVHSGEAGVCARVGGGGAEAPPSRTAEPEAETIDG
jgi:hypothetical protein